MYKRSIPALPPVADPNAAAILAKTRAGAEAVVVNTALNLADVTAAVMETKARKRLNSIGGLNPVVTADEVAQAIVREHAIVAEHAAHRYPAPAAPAWIGPALTPTVVDAAVDPAVDATMGSAVARLEAKTPRPQTAKEKRKKF